MSHERTASGIAFYEDGPSDSPALVLGHALGANSQIWNDVVERLAGPLRIIRWDLPGHGSSATLSAPLTMKHVAELLSHALNEIGVEKFHIGGISFGGTAALALAQHFPDRVRSLAMFDAGTKTGTAQMWHERAALVRTQGTKAIVEDTMERWFTKDFYLGEGKYVCQRIREAYVECDPEGFAACCEVLAETNLAGAPPQISCKTLLVTGEYDAGMKPSQLDLLGADFSRAAVTSMVIPGTKHLTCVQAPEQVSEALKKHTA